MEIELDELRLEHRERLIASLYDFGFCNDTTRMGGGKSFILMSIIKFLNLKNVIMICPSPLVSMWKRLDKRYEINFIAILSYDILRGTSNGEEEVSLSHPFLTRRDKEFSTTRHFKKLIIREGVTVCFDEWHNLKNINRIQRLAAKTLCVELKRMREEIEDCKPSYVYLMSSTPFDKKEHCVNMLDTLGIISSLDLLSKKKPSIYQLKEYCTKINKEITDKIWGETSIKSKTVMNLAYELTRLIILSKVTSFIKIDVNNPSNRQTIYHLFKEIPEIGMELLEICENMIHCLNPKISKKHEKKYAKITNSESRNILSSRSGIIHGQIVSQSVKTYYIIVPIATRFLDTFKKCKVVIFLDYKEPIFIVERMLEEYSVATITADIKKEARDDLISQFQENNSKYRVLVVISQIGSEGLEFDDIHGNRPRFGFDLDKYNIKNTVQAPGRLDRRDTKSNSLHFICRPELGDNKDIDKSMNRITNDKSIIFSQTLKETGIIPPINYAELHYTDETDIKELYENAGKYVYTSKISAEKENKGKNFVFRPSSVKSSWYSSDEDD